MARITIPVYQNHERDGSVASAAKLYFYENRSEPPIFKSIFSDAEMSIGMQNPVILGDSAYTPDIFGDGAYTVICTTFDDVMLWSRDNVIVDSTGGGQFSNWSPINEYSLNAIVRAGDGNYYISLSNVNIGLDPMEYDDSWSKIAFLRYWNQYERYRDNDIAIYDGTAYTSKIDNNIGNVPAAGSEFWSLPFEANVVDTVYGALRANVPWLEWEKSGDDIYLNADLTRVIGVPGGAASLNSLGKVPASQIDIAGGLIYQGVWNASTNTPALPVPSALNDGYYYVVSVAGTHAGVQYFVGDWAVSNGSTWDRIPRDEIGTVAQRDVVTGTVDATGSSIPDVEWMQARGIGGEAEITAASVATPNAIRGLGVKFGMCDAIDLNIPGASAGDVGMLVVNGITETEITALSIEFVGNGQRWLRQAVNGATWGDWSQSGGGSGSSSEMDGRVVIGDVATSGSQTVTIDLLAGKRFFMSMNGANNSGRLTLQMTNIPSSGYVEAVIFIIRGGRKPVDIPAGSKWAQNIIPPMNPAINSIDAIHLYRTAEFTPGTFKFSLNASEIMP